MNLEQPSTTNIKDITLRYLKYWYLFLLFGIIGLATAHVYLKYQIPLFQMTTSLLIKDNEGSGPSENVAFNDLEMFKATKSLDNQIMVLQSNTLMEKTIAELDLQTTYFYKGKVQDVEIYGPSVPIKVILNTLTGEAFSKSLIITFKDNNTFFLEEEEQSDSRTTHNFGQQIKKPYGIFTIVVNQSYSVSTTSDPIIIKFQSNEMLASTYSGRLNVGKFNMEGNALQLSLTDPIPLRGIEVITKLVEVYNKEEVNDKNQAAKKTLEFIDERLRFLTTELSTVERNVEQFKRQNELTDVNSQATEYFSEVTTYNKELSQLAIQQEVLESFGKYLNNPDSKYKLIPSSLSISDPTLTGLITSFNKLQLEREQLLRFNNPDNPLVQNINDQLDNLRINILENIGNIKSSLTITRRNLQQKSTQFGSKMQQVPVVERELIEITREQEIKRSIYTYLLQKREEAALTLGATISNSRTLDPPTWFGPISPNRNNTYLNFMVFGLFIPFAGISLKNFLNNKINSIEELKALTLTPVLGEIPRNKTKNDLVMEIGNRSPIVEVFRHIRAKLHLAGIENENKVILITSSMSGEGKTFFGLNLAASLVLTNKKVVIIDMDLRKPQLSAQLGLSDELGITNYIVSDKINIHDIIHTTDLVDNLHIIGAGPIPPDPAELMLSPKIAGLLNELRSNYDHIIIDSAPIGQVSDALSLGTLIDSSIYLVRYNYTIKKQITIIDEIYKTKTLKRPMIIFNDVKIDKNKKYGYGNYANQKSGKELISK